MIQVQYMKFNQDLLERLFGAYIIANKSHWHCPPVAMIRKQIDEQGFYIYTAGKPENWSTKMAFSLDGTTLKVDVIVNPDLPKSMRPFAQRIRDETVDRMEVIVASEDS